MHTHQDNLRRLGQQLTRLRRQQALTIDQLSTRSGIHSRDIAAIEAGETDPTILTLYALCRGLELPPTELLSFLL